MYKALRLDAGIDDGFGETGMIVFQPTNANGGDMDFIYAAEKFSVARSSLMLPVTHGEASSIASAFHECSIGLADKNVDELDDNARRWVAKIEEVMGTDGLDDPSGEGLWKIKADTFSDDQKLELPMQSMNWRIGLSGKVRVN